VLITKTELMSNQTNEQQIIQLIQEGKTNKEIAAVIFKSLSATKMTVQKIMKKHSCKNRAQLAAKGSNILTKDTS